jgi:hypothetical protein
MWQVLRINFRDSCQNYYLQSDVVIETSKAQLLIWAWRRRCPYIILSRQIKSMVRSKLQAQI